MVYKMNESIIVIQAEATSPNRTNVVFWSHDRGTAKLRMKLVRKNGIPQSLPEGTTVPIRLMFKSATAKGGYGKHDYLATVEDPVNGIVSIVLEDNILGYVGTVEGSVYIDFPNDRSLDTAGRFTFYIKRSPIDDSTPELENYYFNGFSQTIDKIEKILADGKQEIDQKIAESETQIDAKVKDTNDKITKANQDVATLNTNIDKANDRIDQANQQLSDLGKLKKMYSNSIDFGDYDYSGNPNLIIPLKASNFYTQSGVTVEDAGNALKVTFTKTDGAAFLESMKNIPALLPNTQYTLSADVTVSEGYTGKLENLRLGYRKSPNGTIILPLTGKEAIVGQKTRISITANSSTATDPSKFDRMYFTINTTSTDPFVGTVLIENIKVERGSTATPYQPNLLDDPYWLGKAPLGENIANKDVQFPITTTEYSVYSKANVEDYKVNQKYVLTMKATKPATQRFIAYLNGGTIKAADLYPVEGLTDTWQGEFTVTQASIDAGALRTLAVYQFPSETKGTVKIDWLKIEKGDTRTPNISQFKYFGEGLKDSNNPNDYSWDITAEYTEKGLNDSVSLTEPQSVDGTKNFLETPLVNGKNVLVEEKPLPYEAWHSTGTEQTGISNKARLIIGPVATTIGAKLNRSMKENPLTWNSGNWQATANRDCTLLVEGLVRYQFGGSTAGQYGYITFYKDDAQTSSIGFAGGVGINGTALQWKHGLHFSRIFALKKGEYFNITFETQDGKKLDFSQINTLHIMEIES
ncbi:MULTISPECIES: BppU family phage baseplate upper protein [Enterococcus]|uniref:BppU family phage baseplate upper protein n=1 Tax=Enterococcus TaxID=1350 RepID=UPI001879F013|nr:MULTISPECIES: BppU family phage baseplate upper protein [Enterococcus]MBE7390001.1 BppU family phage baseplate upper protein [Enterococcus faecium]MDQ8484535.1 BppU family phage baseplate upper protein [Enterococcus faecium]MEB4617028.1 BppU family phage baseplate upper protein [Enterococcus sp. E4-79]MEB4747760.1 BppU family phage baseplate upper protein [Enterococcus sp. E4-163]HAQ4671822.1 BppU family phage baseplate upper protein [Enterococcus faecium]